MLVLKVLETKGRKFILKKLENCDWGKSKVPIGKEKEIFVSENLVIGYPLMKRRFSRRRDNAPRSVPATSTIIEIISLSIDKETSTCKFRTDNSIYEITLC